MSEYLRNRFKPGTTVRVNTGINRDVIGTVTYVSNLKSCPVEVKLPNAVNTFPYDFSELDVVE